METRGWCAVNVERAKVLCVDAFWVLGCFAGVHAETPTD